MPKKPLPPLTPPEQAAQLAGFDAVFVETFTCKGCQHELTADYSLRTPGYCFLCDEAISLDELLADSPILPSTSSFTVKATVASVTKDKPLPIDFPF